MPLKRPHIGKLGRRGFTIVELMIATSVLSTIILLVSIMMISIGNLYAKGLYQSRTQDTTRTITDQLAQDLKLNNSFTTGSASKPFGGKNITIGAYCIGDNVRYSFIVGYRLGNGPDTTPPTPVLPLVPHVLWRDDNSASTTLGGTVGTCKPLDL
ncbi:MAG TPA: prepilin-type N-terminal cleavage/methylation domain-containing protein, partial [Candidatus Saccharimonadia bacterium]|nr:prepilin-type N-terminal cleavage/methylation domain-containing protein [Candidatus Saccharimonadia bacterium]